MDLGELIKIHEISLPEPIEAPEPIEIEPQEEETEPNTIPDEVEVENGYDGALVPVMRAHRIQ